MPRQAKGSNAQPVALVAFLVIAVLVLLLLSSRGAPLSEIGGEPDSTAVTDDERARILDSLRTAGEVGTDMTEEEKRATLDGLRASGDAEGPPLSEEKKARILDQLRNQ